MAAKEVYHVTFDDTDQARSKGCHNKSQIICRHITEHIVTRLIIILLILIDIGIIIYIAVKMDILSGHYISGFDEASLVISCIFLVEVVMRIYGLGLTFFRNWINVVDLLVVLTTFLCALLSCVIVMIPVGSIIPILRVLTRLPRVLNVIRIIANKDNFLNSSRYITSENKRRYRLDGFDLDLCYITDRVIAMSFPSSGIASLYRNSIQDVSKFLNERHGTGYKVYNLCEERGYETGYFNGQVERYMIRDHNVPRLEDMIKFAKSSREWLVRNKTNVIVVHCKGGKGRTGTMICVHLIDFEVFQTAQLSLEYFGQRRTDLAEGRKFQGIETPSQSRYVQYFEEVKKIFNYKIPGPVALVIERIVLHGIKDIGNGNGSDLWLSIHGSTDQVRDMKVLEVFMKEEKYCKTVTIERDSKTSLEITLLECPPIVNDTKIKFHSFNGKVPKSYDDCAFFFWFHTSFIKENRLVLSREELDNPHKKSTWKVFNSEFGVEVFFKNV